MLMPNIFQVFGLEIILISEITYLWFQSLKNRNTKNLSAFFNLCSALLAFLIINVPVRISDLGLVSWNPKLVFFLNAVYILLETLTAYEWYIYFLTVLNDKLLLSKKSKILISIPLEIMLVLLIMSYKTKWLYFVEEGGKYVRGSLFFLQLIVPFSYLIASMVTALIGYKKNNNKRVFTILLSAFLTSVIAALLQVIFSGSYILAGLSFAVILVYIEMYQYELKQIEKMKSLGIVNEKLENANQKLNETIKELEISVNNEIAANNAKNEFLSRMSHDIRTPLNGIIGILEIDERHPDDVKLLSENRKKAKTAANHLISLINDILDMSKLSSGKYELSNEPFDMFEIANEVCSIVTTSAEKNGITLINENEKDSFSYPYTYGSPLHIKRILLNIIGNAIKYNKKDGSVTLKLEHNYIDDNNIKYTITVSDTGIGMSEEYITKLFEPFSQEHIDARSVYDGSGLGMAITKALVEKMGGNILVNSKVDIGTTFIIELAFRIAEQKSFNELSENNEDLHGIKILLAEDNDLNIDIAQTLLEEMGAEVVVAENGKLAYETFINYADSYFDIILMDCMMPVMDGYEATKAIRQSNKANSYSIPIVAMTANAFSDDVNKCLEAGMNDHLSKPFDIKKVIKTIKRYVE